MFTVSMHNKSPLHPDVSEGGCDEQDEFIQRMTAKSVLGWLYTFLALLGIAGPLLLLFAEFVALPWAANYSLVRDSISSLAWTGMGWIQTVSFVATALFVEGFAAVLLLGMQGARGFNLGIILLTCSGFSLLLVGAFRTDIPYLPPTVDGTIHGIAANTMSLLLPLAILLISPSLKKNSYWRSLFIYSIATAAFALIWIAIYRLWLPKELSWFGLYERILAIVEITWIEVMAIWLLPLSPRPVQNTSPVSNAPLTSE